MNNKIQIITKDNTNYPDLLKSITKPPEKLYVKGNKNLLNEKAIAIWIKKMYRIWEKNSKKNII